MVVARFHQFESLCRADPPALDVAAAGPAEREDELPPLLAFPMRGEGVLTRGVVRMLRKLHPSPDFQIAAYESRTAEDDFTFEILPWFPDPPLVLERAPGYRLVGLVDLTAGRVIPIVQDVTGATLRSRNAPPHRAPWPYPPWPELLVGAAMLWALGVGVWPWEE